MSGLSVLTLVRNRERHLVHLVEGLRRSRLQPDELMVVDMSDRPIAPLAADFPIRIDRFETDGLPLAAARNRAAAGAAGDRLVFLDVDCIPMRDCLGRMDAELTRRDGLLCADVRYLAPGEPAAGWGEDDLMRRSLPHPIRAFPSRGVRREKNAGLFWSLAFAVRRPTFDGLGGFDEAYVGYGAEDTDMGFRAEARRIPLFFIGGALACHQYHDSHDPPVQHLRDIVRNARLFHARWGRWPMEGWLDAFRAMGLIRWNEHSILLERAPTAEELIATCIRRGVDRSAPSSL